MVKRKTNNRFAVIDFETANGYRETVCSVGVVIIENCKIVDKFYSHHPGKTVLRYAPASGPKE